MTGADELAESDTRRDAYTRDVVRTRRRVLAGSAALLGTLGVAGTAGAAAGTTAASQSDSPTIRVSFADDEVDAGDTTRLELVLSEVPDEGLTGWTILAELTGSGRAVFTGEGEFTDLMALAELDTENTDSDSAAFFNGANGGSVRPGDEDLLIGDVEVQAVEDGSVEVDFDVEELSDGDSSRIDAEIGSASFTVNGTDDEFDGIGGGDGDEGDSDDGSADGDGTPEVDPAPGDSDDGGDVGDSDDGSGDDGDGASDDGDGDGDSGESDDDSADSVPGFGIGAAVTAVLAGTAARIARGAGDDETEVVE